MNKLAIVGSLLAAATLQCTALAQGVWRCGADGRSFSDRPCADGQPLQMAELAAPRPAIDVQAAQAVAVRDKRLAELLRQERLVREQALLTASPAPATARRSEREAGLSAKPPARQSPSKARPRAPADDGTWRAVAPSSRRGAD